MHGIGAETGAGVAADAAPVFDAMVQDGIRDAATEGRTASADTGIWLIRHALVEENARLRLYGSQDVPLCPESLVAQAPMYRALAQRLPRPASWLCTPLSRTRRTAEAIFAAGYPAQDLAVEPGLIEQSLGEWHGLEHAALPARLSLPAHPFWPHAGTEKPPGGESTVEVIARVGAALERLADQHASRQVGAVAHGGSIRAAVAHALRIEADQALHLSVQNLSLTRLERVALPGASSGRGDRSHAAGGHAWRVICVNELPGY